MLPDGVGAKRKWVYEATSSGFFRKLHRASGAVLLVLLFGVPWIRIEGAPLFLMDIGARRFYHFGGVFTPRDGILPLLVLVVLGMLLFLFTSLYGRLWCGFACPQTVLLEELVRPIERVFEGESGARRKLDSAPWTVGKALRKGGKWLSFGAVAMFLSISTMGLFFDAYRLWSLESSTTAYVLVVLFAAVLFLDFAWFREQFCNYLCPYARLQGVLTDRHTLTVGYDVANGEPRRPRGAAGKAHSIQFPKACVDCSRCVQVCPAGIDIRNGFQLECIACGHCIDACTDVMGKLGQPTLVRYASEAQLHGDSSRPPRRFRPWIYGGIMTVALAGAVLFLVNRSTFDVTISQPRDSASIDGGVIRNRYELTLFNNTLRPQEFTLHAEGLPQAEVVIPGGKLHLEPSAKITIPAFVSVPTSERLRPVEQFAFVIRTDEQVEEHRRASFRHPPEKRP